MEATELQPVPNEQEDGCKQGQGRSCFGRDHWTELDQQEEQEQEGEMAEEEDLIVV